MAATPDLDQSWDYEVDESNISWAEESSQEHENKQGPSSISMAQIPRTPPNSQRRHAPEPELVMPSPQQTASGLRYRQQHMPPPPPPPSHRQSARTTPSRPIDDRYNPTQHSKRARSAVGEVLSEALGNSVMFVLDIFGQTLRTLKTPISWILAAYMLAAFVTVIQNLITSSVYSALSPVCRIPGVQYFNLPICQYSLGAGHPTIAATAEAPTPEFDALMATQQHFEEILADQSHAVGLPIDMKRSETSIRDLRQVVRYSTIPSKNELLHEFDGFVETARIASYDLQKFNSHVGRGVDIVLSTAKWTQRVLDDLDVKAAQRGLLPSFISDTLLGPFKPLQFTEARLLVQYIEHTNIVSGEIEKLIEEAQVLLMTLQNLEDRLEVIHGISLRDNLQISADKEELLGSLWFKIGGSRTEKRKADRKLELLREVGKYRRNAFQHVATTIVKLQGMRSELEELRTRVGSAAALQEAGAKPVPLSVHIENIQLGVERLEIGRERVRDLEQKQRRKVLDDSVDEKGSARLLDAT